MCCTRKGCTIRVKAKGLCRKHYTASWRAQNKDSYRKKQRISDKKRFARRSIVEKEVARLSHAAYQREWRRRHAPRLRESEKYGQRYLRRYGLTAACFQKLMKKQRGVCAICGEPPKTKRLAVDHCHKTNKVRGLLCDGCNHGIGMLKDNPGLCRKAAKYLTCST